MTTTVEPLIAGQRHRPAVATLWRVLGVAQRHWYVLRRSRTGSSTCCCGRSSTRCCSASIAVFAASRTLTTGQQLVAYTLAGMILWQVVYQAQIALATGFLEETFARNLLNLMATPLREWEYVAGVALFGLAKLLCGVGVVATLAWVAYAFDLTTLGLRPDAGGRAAAGRRLGDRAVRHRAGAALRQRRRGLRLGRAVHRHAAVRGVLPGRGAARRARAGGRGCCPRRTPSPPVGCWPPVGTCRTGSWRSPPSALSRW